MEEPVNPFAAPSANADVASSVPSGLDPEPKMRPFNLKLSILKWVLICTICGAPSFFFGFVVESKPFLQGAAMVAGILTYAAFYVFIESREVIRRRLANDSLRIAVKIGYGTRVVISILFPVGLQIDMFCGLMSVGLMSSILGSPEIENAFSGGLVPEDVMIFVWFYLTTLVQGTLMNLILGAFVLIVFVITMVVRGR